MLKELIAKTIFKIQGKKRSGAPLALTEAVIWPALVISGFIYYSLNLVKWALYRYGVLPPYISELFTVSAGNIKVGGTGKSPLIIKLAAALVNSGTPAAVINRGYLGPVKGLNVISDGLRLLKGVDEASDEAYMEALALIGGKDNASRYANNRAVIEASGRLAAFGENKITVEKGAPVLTSKQRIDSVKYLENTGFNGVCLLDDAFQYYRLVKNINIVVLDHKDPFSNGLTFPAGALRDRISRLGEADIIIISRCPSKNLAAGSRSSAIESVCRRNGFKGNIYRSGMEITGLYSAFDDRKAGFSELAGSRAFLVAAIADNASLFAAAAKKARENGFEIFCEGFLDHSGYGEAAQRGIASKMIALGAGSLITTFKDVVKLRRDIFGGRKVYSLLFDLWIEGEEKLLKEIKAGYDKFKGDKGRVR
jgi:tetraacyldisaccharide 4'-kinase